MHVRSITFFISIIQMTFKWPFYSQQYETYFSSYDMTHTLGWKVTFKPSIFSFIFILGQQVSKTFLLEVIYFDFQLPRKYLPWLPVIAKILIQTSGYFEFNLPRLFYFEFNLPRLFYLEFFKAKKDTKKDKCVKTRCKALF